MFQNEPTKAPTALEVAAGAKSLEDIVDEINHQHDRAIESVKQLACLCADAAALAEGNEDRFFSRLKFDRSKFNKFVQIGKCHHMWSPAIAPHLPSGYSSLYQVALLSDELSPEVGDGSNREGGISWGCLTTSLLHRRSDMPCRTITLSD
jgi:hypothetical protein